MAQGSDDDEQLRMLLEVTNAVVANLDLREVVRSVAASLRQVVSYDSAVLFIYDAESGRLKAHALESTKPEEKPDEGYYLDLDGTASGKAFTEGRTRIYERSDLIAFPKSMMMRFPHTSKAEAACCVPLIAGDRVLGVLTLVSDVEACFNDENVGLIEAITAQVALAVENALNYGRAIAEKDRFEMLLDTSNALSAVLDLKDVLKITSSMLRRHVRHDFAAVGLFDETTQQFRILALDNPPDNFQDEGTFFPAEGTPDLLAVRTRQTVLRTKVDLEEFPSPFIRKVYDMGFRSFCCVPLISRDHAIGVLAVGANVEGAFRPEDGATMQLIANQIAGTIENAVHFNEIERLKNQLASEKLYLEEEIQNEYNFEEIVGNSPALKKVLRQIETVAPTDSCVLLYGETGTGKELISRAIHNLSKRRNRTLVKLNCAAIPTGLLESELFGHEKGAFTGAIAMRVGRFELANKGTLLLDEIGDIPLELQPKLLRVLQESEFERLGSSRTVRSDVRLIAATNRDLQEMVAERTFRSDLYYRLNVFPIRIPPLRERPEDIPLLAGYFTKKHAGRMSKRITTIPRESIDALCSYDFPGNVRELENFIERAVILTSGDELQIPISELRHFDRPVTDDGAHVNHSLEAIERNHIVGVLKSTGGRIAGTGGAAQLLDLPVSTLRNRMKKLGIPSK
ncbi:MAG: sigma 54-interacting transcriptional regulator [Pyrinomonadaceae bacterium]